jgi:hypothetical protein
LEKALDPKWARVNDVFLNIFGLDEKGRCHVQNIIKLVVLEQAVECAWDSDIWNGNKAYVILVAG